MDDDLGKPLSLNHFGTSKKLSLVKAIFINGQSIFDHCLKSWFGFSLLLSVTAPTYGGPTVCLALSLAQFLTFIATWGNRSSIRQRKQWGLRILNHLLGCRQKMTPDSSGSYTPDSEFPTRATRVGPLHELSLIKIYSTQLAEYWILTNNKKFSKKRKN